MMAELKRYNILYSDFEELSNQLKSIWAISITHEIQFTMEIMTSLILTFPNTRKKLQGVQYLQLLNCGYENHFTLSSHILNIMISIPTHTISIDMNIEQEKYICSLRWIILIILLMTVDIFLDIHHHHIPIENQSKYMIENHSLFNYFDLYHIDAIHNIFMNLLQRSHQLSSTLQFNEDKINTNNGFGMEQIDTVMDTLSLNSTNYAIESICALHWGMLLKLVSNVILKDGNRYAMSSELIEWFQGHEYSLCLELVLKLQPWESLITILTKVLNKPTVGIMDEVSGRGDISSIICQVLQTSVQVGLLSEALDMSDVSVVASLVELLYRGQPQLCLGFWSPVTTQSSTAMVALDESVHDRHIASITYDTWIESKKPLHHLIGLLLSSTPHDPMYLIKILNALCSSRHASEACAGILLQHTLAMISYEALSDLEISVSSNMTQQTSVESATGSLVNHTVDHTWIPLDEYLKSSPENNTGHCIVRLRADAHAVMGLGAFLQSASPSPSKIKHLERRERSLLVSAPSVTSEGKIVDMDSVQSGVVTVRWNTQTSWLAIIIDILRVLESSSNLIDDMNLELLADSMSLLSSIISRSSDVEDLYLSMESQWNDICLRHFRKIFGIHPLLLQIIVREDIAMNMIYNEPERYGQLILSRVGNNYLEEIRNFVENILRLKDIFQFKLSKLLANVTSRLLLRLTTFESKYTNIILCSRSISSCIFLLSRLLLGGSGILSEIWRMDCLSSLCEHFPVTGNRSLPNCMMGIIAHPNIVHTDAECIASLSADLFRSILLFNAMCGNMHIVNQIFVGQMKKKCRDEHTVYIIDSIGFQEGLRRIGLSDGITSNELNQLFLLLSKNKKQILVTDLMTLNVTFLNDSDAFNSKELIHLERIRIEVWNILESQLLLSSNIILSRMDGQYSSPIHHIYNNLTISASNMFQLYDSIIFEFILPFLSRIDSIISMNANYVQRWNMLLSYLECIMILFTRSATIGMFPGYDKLLRKIAENITFIEILVQITTMLGTFCCQMKMKSVIENHSTPKTLKSLLQSASSSFMHNASSSNMSSGAYSKHPNLFPIDFTTILKWVHPNQLDALVELSNISLETLYQLFQYIITSHPILVPDILNILSKNVNAKLLSVWMPIPKPKIYANTPDHKLACSNLALISGWLSFPALGDGPSTQLILQILSLVLDGQNLLETQAPLIAKVSFADMLGQDGMLVLSHSISTRLRSKEYPLGVKSEMLSFMSYLSSMQPWCMDTLLQTNVSSSTVTQDRTQRQSTLETNQIEYDIVDCMEKMVLACDCPTSSTLQGETSLLLYQTIELVLLWWKLALKSSLCVTSYKLVQNKQFLSKFLDPLLDNITSVSTIINGLSVKIDDYETVLDEVPLLLNTSYDTLLHSAGFNILCFERMHIHLQKRCTGKSKQKEFSESLCNFIGNFLEKANQNHRFLSWMSLYSKIDFNPDIYNDTENEMNNLNIGLQLLMRRSTIQKARQLNNQKNQLNNSLTNTSLLFNASYIYDENALSDHIGVVLLAAQDAFHNDISYNYWKGLSSQLGTLNIMLALSDAQYTAFHNWKLFLEVYVTSPANKVSFRNPSEGRHSSPSQYSPVSRSSPTIERNRTSSYSSIDIASGTTGTMCPPSPATSKESTFQGDKRSYCIVKEIAGQLADDMKLGSNIVKIIITVEKCDLLMSMIHHQLKEVHHRASDPKHSLVEFRDLGSSRLNPTKINEILQLIESANQRIDEELDMISFSGSVLDGGGFEGNPFSNINLKKSVSNTSNVVDVSIRLLSASLILLTAIESSGRKLSNKSEILLNLNHLRPSLLRRATLLTQHELKTRGLESFQTYSPHMEDTDDTDHTSSTSGQNIINVCLRVMCCVIPLEECRGDSLYGQSAIDWKKSGINNNQFGTLLITLFAELVSRHMNIFDVSTEFDYSEWKDVSSCFPGGNIHACVPPCSYSKNDEKHSRSRLAYGNALCSIIDLSLRCIGKIDFVEQDFHMRLLSVIIRAPLFHKIQELLYQQKKEKVGAFMGYSARDGEHTIFIDVWQRVINFIVCCCHSHSVFNNKQLSDNTIESYFVNGLCQFLESYSFILLLPLHDESLSRCSLQQLHLCKIVLNLFHTIDKTFRTWRAILPQLYKEVERLSFKYVSKYSILLGVDITHQRLLHGLLIAVSRTEKKDECSQRNR